MHALSKALWTPLVLLFLSSSLLSTAGLVAQPFEHVLTFGEPLLNAPIDVAIDEDGILYVLEYQGREVRKLTSDGELLDRWDLGVEPHPYYAPGQLRLDGLGNLFVLDAGGSRLLRFDLSGKPLGEWQTRGWFFDTTPDGRIFVLVPPINDRSPSTLEVFDTEGSLLKTQEFPEDLVPAGLIVDADDNIIVSAQGLFFFDSEMNLRFQSGQHDAFELYRIIEGPSGRIFVSTSDSQIDVFDGENGAFLSSIGGPGRGHYPVEGTFRFPYGMAFDPEGHLWVADESAHRVQKFDLDGNVLGQVGGGNFTDLMEDPRKVVVDSHGNIYVLDFWWHRIRKYDPSGRFLLAITGIGDTPFEIYGIYGLAIDAEDRLYVTEIYWADPSATVRRFRIQKFDTQGNFLGTALDVPDSLPTVEAVDSSGNLYIVVRIYNQSLIQVRSPSGALLSEWVGRVGALAVDAQRNVYIQHRQQVDKFTWKGELLNTYQIVAADIEVDRLGNIYGIIGGYLLKYDARGNLIAMMDDIGTGPSQLGPSRHLTIDALGNIFIADSANNRVQVFNDRSVLGCSEDEDTACLGEAGRFEVSVQWQDATGAQGSGKVFATGIEDSSLFWFFSEDNLELLVKVLDGCAINGHFWVFSAGMTDLEYTMTVHDKATGSVKRYENSQGNAAPAVTDTLAFSSCSLSTASPTTGSNTFAPSPSNSGVMSVMSAHREKASSEPCVANDSTLCLGAEGRFKVTLEWVADNNGSSSQGDANTRPLDLQDSGLFWFFDPQNIEMLVKVLDGCALNGHRWVFAAGTTNLGHTLRVEDTHTGEVRTYTNPLGQSTLTVTDTLAFAGC